MKNSAYPGPEFFSNNRKNLKEAFAGKAPIVIAGNSLMQKSNDMAYPFTQDSSFWYLTGIHEPGLVLVIEPDREYVILPQPDASRDTFNGEIDQDQISKISGIETVFSYEDGWKNLEKKIKKSKHVATIPASPGYIHQLTMFTSPARALLIKKIKEHNADISLIDLKLVLASLRSVKQKLEIELMKSAIAHTAELYGLIESKRNKAKSETELMAHLAYEVARRSIDYAYDPIFAGGKNALTLHYIQNNSALDEKEFLLVDVGARVHGYNADITRTVVNHPNKRQQAVYDAVLNVQEYAISLIKDGTQFASYEESVNQYMGEKLRELGLIKTISREAVRKYYPHSTSHFLGIDAHDAGDYESPMKSGMVITVEPGIYITEEGIGVRIEDDILVTKNGSKILSAAIPKSIDRLG